MFVATVNYQDVNAAKLFTDSLRETGFAVLTHHPIDPKLIDSVYNDWQAFFESDDKHQYRFKQGEEEGYIPMEVAEKAKGHDVLDLKEFYQAYLRTPLPETVGPSSKILANQLVALAEKLLTWIEQETPADIRYSQPLSSMINASPRTLFRILHYPPLTGAEAKGAIRSADHEDINLITVLPAATTTGLQVKDRQGRWHDVPADPGSIIVNAGDMLQECSGGYYKATTHRVCNPSDETSRYSRYSMPLFVHPHKEVVLSQRHTAGSYLDERLRENGILKAGESLNAA